MARKYGASFHGVASAKSGQDSAVIAIGWGFPFCPPARKQKARAGGMQIINTAHQARHIAGLEDQPMKAPVGFLPTLHIWGVVTNPRCFLSFIKNCLGQIGRSIAERHCLKCRAHSSDLSDLLGAEAGNPHATTRLADGKSLRLQATKRLSHRDMAGAKFCGDVILTQFVAGTKRACNDPICKDAADFVSQGFFGTIRH